MTSVDDAFLKANEIQIRRLVVDLKRLLHRMETYNSDDLSSYSVRGRATMANEMLLQLEKFEFPGFPELQGQVHDAYQKAEELAVKRKQIEVDYVDMVFFQPNRKPKNDEDIEEIESETLSSLNATISEIDNEDTLTLENQKEKVSTCYKRFHCQNKDIEGIQKVQREQLEAEIAHMASQLKASTQFMNTTLRGQTENLEKMEDLASENVSKVRKAAENVGEHNKLVWSSTMATWTMFLTVVATFIFCLLTIKMFPKQANTKLPCFFNCNENEKKEKSVPEQLEDLKAKQQKMELKTNQMRDEMKVHENGCNDNQCSAEMENDESKTWHIFAEKLQQQNDAANPHPQGAPKKE